MFANAPDSLCIDERGGIKMNWLHNYTHMSFLEIQEGSASCSLVDVLELPTLHISDLHLHYGLVGKPDDEL